MVELVDSVDLGSTAKSVQVRVLLPAPEKAAQKGGLFLMPVVGLERAARARKVWRILCGCLEIDDCGPVPFFDRGLKGMSAV